MDRPKAQLTARCCEVILTEVKEQVRRYGGIRSRMQLGEALGVRHIYDFVWCVYIYIYLWMMIPALFCGGVKLPTSNVDLPMSSQDPPRLRFQMNLLLAVFCLITSQRADLLTRA